MHPCAFRLLRGSGAREKMGVAMTASALHTGPATKWSDDAFLDSIRQHGDQLADDCVRGLKADGVRTPEITRVFRAMAFNGAPIPEDTPPRLRAYLEETGRLPPGTDIDRVDRGQAAFMTHCIPSVLVLLLKSIPEGYAAPALTRILSLSGELRDNPYHRLMGTLQLLIDVSSPHGFEPGRERRGIVSTQQVRLLHAGVRVNVAPNSPAALDYDAYRREHGLPINLEDMLGTLIGFSLLVVHGLRTLRVRLGPRGDGKTPAVPGDGTYTEAEEAYYYVWRTFGRMFGIHPPGQPQSLEFLPASLTEAAEFYASYCRRHYVGATSLARGWRARSEAENRDGVELADAHVRMIGVVVQHVLPRPLRPMVPGPSLRLVPRIYARQLIGEEGCARIGIRPVTLFLLLKWLLFHFPQAWARLWGRVDSRLHVRISEMFLERLVKIGYAEGVTFTVPGDLQDLKNLVERGWSA